MVIAVLFVLFIHSWKDAGCTEPERCAFCGKTRGEALGHEWLEATCTEPETCGRCGETRGEALGHVWTEATCIAPKTCSVCGASEGSAAGHSWVEATYDAPKTCSVCGEQTGNLKGFVGELDWDWGETQITLESARNYPLQLSTPIHDCFRLTMDFMMEDPTGDVYGTWHLYICDLNGEWIKVDSFKVDESANGAYVTYKFEFDTPRSFTAIVPARDRYSGSFHTTYYVELYDAQVME